MAIRRKEKTQN